MNTFINMPFTTTTTSFITEHEMKKLESYGEVTRNPYDRNLTHDELPQYIIDAEVIITGWGHCMINSDLVKNAKNLMVILHTGGSVADYVDINFLKMICNKCNYMSYYNTCQTIKLMRCDYRQPNRLCCVK